MTYPYPSKFQISQTKGLVPHGVNPRAFVKSGVEKPHSEMVGFICSLLLKFLFVVLFVFAHPFYYLLFFNLCRYFLSNTPFWPFSCQLANYSVLILEVV